MADYNETVAMWQELANDADPSVQAEAKAELGRLGAIRPPMQGPTPGPYKAEGKAPVDILEATRMAAESRRGAEASSPGRKARIAREIAGGYTPPPTTADSIAAMFDPEQAINDTTAAMGRFNENFAFGLPARLGDLLGITSQKQRDEFAAKSPTAAKIGGLTGTVSTAIGGPEAGVAKLAQKGVSAAAKAVPELASTMTGRALSQTVAGAGTAAAVEGARSAIAGDDLKQMGERIVDAIPAGAVTGGAGSMLTEMPLFLRQLVQRDPWVARYAAARNAGTLKNPEVAELPEGKPGIAAASDRAQQRITTRNAERMTNEGQLHEQAVNAAVAASPEQSANPAAQQLYSLASRNRTRSGQVRDPELESAINEAFDLLDVNPASGGAATTDLLAARKTLEAKAQFGQPATKENRPYRQIYDAFNQSLKGQPGQRTPVQEALAAADERFADQANQSERLNDVLYSTEETNVARGERGPGQPDVRAAKERTAAQNLSRVGDDTEAGSVRARQMQELYDSDPEFAHEIDLILAKKSQEATRPGLPQVSTNLPKLMSVPGILGIAGQNVRALNARLVDPAAELGARAIRRGSLLAQPMVPTLRDPFDAELERQRRKKK